jgi:kynurenine formamidase
MTDATGTTRALRAASPGPQCCEGVPHGLTTAQVLRAVRSVREGRIYDLSRIRFRGMPLPAMHPPFEIMTYRSPAGLLVGNDDGLWPSGEQNRKQVGFITEMVMTCTHVGTHVDSLAHITVGENAEWFGGHCVGEHLGDFGPTHADASTLPPMVTRGVLLDVARFRGVAALPASAGIDAEELRAVMAMQGVEVGAGDVVLIRTGFGSVWPDTARIPEHAGAGITEDAARLLADAGVIAVGADTEAVEQLPSAIAGNPHPVHTLLLVERGVPLIEMLDLELVAADERHEFLFAGLPTKIRYATGAMLDPVAIV